MRRIVGGFLLLALVVACTSEPPSRAGTYQTGLPDSSDTSPRPTEHAVVDPHNPVTPGF